jgi:cyanophycinase
MSLRFLTPVLVTMLIAIFTASCASRGGEGHLMIVGGALSRDNNLIYDEMARLGGANATAGILPTASGVPEESGASAVSRFQQLLGEANVELIPVTFQTPELADDPAIAAQIRKHDIIWFVGGDQSRIIDAFRRPGDARGDTEGYRALLSVLKRDGLIGGTSAGAAMMSDPAIGGGSSEKALESGRGEYSPDETEERGVVIRDGMGFFPYGIVDQHFLARGRLGRLIAALEETGVARGYGIDEDSAIAVNLNTGEIRVLGPQGLILADVRRLSRQGLARENIRISMLSTGDSVDGDTGRITHAAGYAPFNAMPDAPSTLAPIPDAWGRWTIRTALLALAESNASEVLLTGERFDIRFSKDSDTYSIINPTQPGSPVSVVNARMDIVHKASAGN